MKEEKIKKTQAPDSRDKPEYPDSGGLTNVSSDREKAAVTNDNGIQPTLTPETAPVCARQYILTGKQRKAWLQANARDISYIEIHGRQASVKKPTAKVRKKAVKLFVAVLALVCLLLSFPAGKLIAARFVIKQIILDGEGSYTAAELAAAAGIGIDGSLIGAGGRAREAMILEAFPAIKTCSVKAELSGDVVLTYSEYEALIYFESAGRYYSADKNLYVIAVSDSPEEFRRQGLVPARLPEIRTVLCGHTLEFADTDGEYIKTFLAEAEKIPGQFAELSFENKFAVCSENESGYTVNYGTVSDLETKLKLVNRVIECGTVAENQVIDVSVQGKASIRGKKQGSS